MCVWGGGGRGEGDNYIVQVFQIFKQHLLVFFDMEVICCLLELLMQRNREINEVHCTLHTEHCMSEGNIICEHGS